MTTEWTIFLMIFVAIGTALVCAIGFKIDAKEEMKALLKENEELHKENACLREMLENRL